MAWTVIINCPGYLPDTDPTGWETFDQACDAVAHEIETTADTMGADDGALADVLALVEGERAQGVAFTIQFGGLAHSVEKAS